MGRVPRGSGTMYINCTLICKSVGQRRPSHTPDTRRIASRPTSGSWLINLVAQLPGACTPLDWRNSALDTLKD